MPGMHDDWKDAKKQFEKLTGKHKPAEKFMIFFHKGTDIDSCLKVCDALVAANTIDTKKLTAAMKDLKDASDGYLATLKAEKAQETGGSKDIITVVSKGISSLRQSLKKYEAYFATKLKEAEVLAGVGDAKQKMIDGMLVPYKSNVKAALANAKAAAARLQTVAIKLASDGSKIGPAVALYNSEINGKEAARKLTTALGAYGNLVKMGADVSGLQDPAKHIASLAAYSGRVDAPNDTDPRDLIRMITEFETKVKAIGKDYQ